MTDTATPDVVPLPAHLSECGCSGADMGRHLTSCIPAREHDAIDLRDRPEYAQGVRFRAISWEYPLRFTMSIEVTVELDPALYLAERLDEYDAFDQEDGEEWEKPLAFISERITEEFDIQGMTSFDGGRHVSRCTSYIDEVVERPRWNAEDTVRLHEVLATKRVDPNQGTLGV